MRARKANRIARYSIKPNGNKGAQFDRVCKAEIVHLIGMEGHDIIIRQASGGHREVDLLTAAGGVQKVRTDRGFVRMTGGGYFFVPSISAVSQFLAKMRRRVLCTDIRALPVENIIPNSLAV
jgi:hypothetical protein